MLAGEHGFEPWNGGFKGPCLTTWRLPKACAIVAQTICVTLLKILHTFLVLFVFFVLLSMPTPHSETTRLEAFSDGMFSILITIMVLELHLPHEPSLHALLPLAPIFLSYVLSFFYLAIYWNNHHHLLHATEGITGGIMWANLHLLFWLSLVPFTTNWVGEFPTDAMPAATYGFVLLMAACAYYILQRSIVAHDGKHSPVAKALGKDIKGKISIVLYLLGMATAFVHQGIAYGIFVFVALMWIVPDRRLAPIFDHLDD